MIFAGSEQGTHRLAFVVPSVCACNGRVRIGCHEAGTSDIVNSAKDTVVASPDTLSTLVEI